jgi:hypothetical protein
MIKILIALAVIAVIYYMWRNQWFAETMGPLDTGVFPNHYPRGRCNAGNMGRTSCEVGTCPLESTISNKEYCAIQCAQDPDKQIRDKCYDQCVDMMDCGCR